MAKKGTVTLVLGVFVLLAVTAVAWAPCEEFPDYACGIQCGGWGPGIYCIDPSNPSRACWDSGTGGACGEANPYEGCTCQGGLVADGGF